MIIVRHPFTRYSDSLLSPPSSFTPQITVGIPGQAEEVRRDLGLHGQEGLVSGEVLLTSSQWIVFEGFIPNKGRK